MYNCKDEIATFENLLRCKDQKRILLISEESGWGKTLLQKKLHNKCLEHDDRPPVCHIEAKTVASYSPFMFVQHLVYKYKQWIKFNNFEHIDTARLAGDFSVAQSFAMTPDRNLSLVKGTVRLDHADFRYSYDTQIAGQIFNTNFTFNTDDVHPDLLDFLKKKPEPKHLTEQQQEKMQNLCIEEFFKDLREFSRNRKHRRRPIVLLIDGVDDLDKTLKDWFFGEFMEKCFFELEERPKRMLLVLTAQARINLRCSPDRQEEIAIEKQSLRSWKLSDVEACLAAEGADIPGIAPGLFKTLTEGRLTPLNLVQAAQALNTQRVKDVTL